MIKKCPGCFIALLIFAALLLNACFSSIKKTYLAATANEYNWENTIGNTLYRLEILSGHGIYFNGLLHISKQDKTVDYYLMGFEKGNDHPATVKTTTADSTKLGFIRIWSFGKNNDSLEIDNWGNLKAFPAKLKLYREKK